MTFGWVIPFPGTYSSQMPTELYVVLFIIEQYQNSPCVPVTRNQGMPLYLIYPMKGILHFDQNHKWRLSRGWHCRRCIYHLCLTVVSLEPCKMALRIASLQKIFVKLFPQYKTCIQRLERKYSRILTGGSFWVMSLCMIWIFSLFFRKLKKFNKVHILLLFFSAITCLFCWLKKI